MAEPVSLLPPNSTPFERAESLTSAARYPLPYEIVRHAVDPWKCPSHLLPWLAWSWSVDLWNDKWSDERKRQVIARAIELHRLKGTPAGLRRHVKLVDAEVKQIIVPPQRAFAGRAISKEELDVWLLTMPQIRVYLAREVGNGQGLSFFGKSFAGHLFVRFDAGRALLGRAARLWDRGAETPLKIVDLTTERESRQALRIERVSIPGHAGGAAFVGRFFRRCYFNGVAKLADIVTYRQDLTYDHKVSSLSIRPAYPTFSPVDVRSDRISETGYAGPAAFAGRFFGRVFVMEDRAEWMLYDRIVLNDPERASVKVKAWSFYNHSRLGIQPHTAKVVIDLKTKLHRRAAAVGRFYGHCYARPENTLPRENANLAIRVSKSARDRILVTYKTTRLQTFADGIPLDGTFRFGARIPFRL